MSDLIRRLARPSLLLLALSVALIGAVAVVSPAGAAKAPPQCSDGVDNDGDGAVDGADIGCGPGSDDTEADSPYYIPPRTVPVPVITVQGTVNSRGVVDVSRFLIRALAGSRVSVTCTGKKCPFKKSERQMISTSLRLTKLEGKLKPKIKLVFKIGRPDELGKYMEYTIRKNKAPLRFDSCLNPDTGKQRGCFAE